MKTYNGAILVICLIFISSRLVANVDVNISTLEINPGYDTAEFSICESADPISTGKGWRYAIRYIQYDGNQRFALILLRSSNKNKYVLELHKNTDYTKFDQLSDKAKSSAASAVKEIDQSFAQILYQTWTMALLHAHFGNGSRTVMGRDLYYISAYSFQTGYMNADSYETKAGSTTGDICHIANLITNYMGEKDGQLDKEIIARCSDYINKNSLK